MAAALPKIQKRIGWIIGITLISAAATFLLPPFPQDPTYHDFADKRYFLGMPYFANVVSNLFFALAGLFGFYAVSRTDETQFYVKDDEKWPYIMAFTGALLVAVGSADYHLNPNNITLLWDRLPMSIIFMSIMCMMVAERISSKAGFYLLFQAITLGIVLTSYWGYSERIVAGDLRFYGVAQGIPFLALLLMLFLLPARYNAQTYWYAMLAVFMIARLCELADKPIFFLTGKTISGHTLKHIGMAVALCLLAEYLRKRKPILM